MPMWWRQPFWRRVTLPEVSTVSWRTLQWVSSLRPVGVALGRELWAAAGVARWGRDLWGQTATER
jgi:hypothetical protein